MIRSIPARLSLAHAIGETARAACAWLLCTMTVMAVLGSSARAQAVFDFDTLSGIARERAGKPWQPPAAALPPDLAALDYDGMRDIRFKPEQALWRDAGLPFEAMFFHVGPRQSAPVHVHEITDSGSRALPFRKDDFDYGKNRFPSDGGPANWAAAGNAAQGDLGFSGFRIHYPLNNPAYKDELIVFQGASYFRALGAGQQYGLSARGLGIDTAGGSGPEEFPRFSEFWLRRPGVSAAGAATRLEIFALLESPRATGAYRFEVRPGESTVVAVRARVFLREGAAPIGTLGIAPLTSMFLSGENQPRAGDFRPEVHDSDGLMIATADGEWLWRPLQNPGRPIVNSFAVGSLRGFGLMQRDRAFASYEDTEAHYERRPSAWVRPLGDWGPGRVELLQLPTPDETHDNIAAYWVPKVLPAPGTPLEFAYELSWQGARQERPPSSWVAQSRRGIGYDRDGLKAKAGEVQYVVDFTGPALDALPADAPVRAVVSGDANTRVIEQLAWRLGDGTPNAGGWRMTVRVQRLDPARPAELRAFLQHHNDTVSETWSNIILPD